MSLCHCGLIGLMLYQAVAPVSFSFFGYVLDTSAYNGLFGADLRPIQ